MSIAVTAPPIDPAGFHDRLPIVPVEPRAGLGVPGPMTLWFDTARAGEARQPSRRGTSAARAGSRPVLSAAEVASRLDAAATAGVTLHQVGFAGGEPFANRELPAMLADALDRGLSVVVVTEATQPMRDRAEALQGLRMAYGGRLMLCVRLDRPAAPRPQPDRGADRFDETLFGLGWLAEHGFAVQVAARCGSESQAATRRDFAALFAAHGIAFDAANPAALMLWSDAAPRDAVPPVPRPGSRPRGRDAARGFGPPRPAVLTRRGDRPPAL